MKHQHSFKSCLCFRRMCRHRKQTEAQVLKTLHLDFTSQMQERSLLCLERGKNGWDSFRVPSEAFRLALLKCLDEGDYIDAANHIMFLWNRQEPKP